MLDIESSIAPSELIEQKDAAFSHKDRLLVLYAAMMAAGLPVLYSPVLIGGLPVPYSVALAAGLTIMLWPLIVAGVHGLVVLCRLGSGRPHRPRGLSGSKQKARTPFSVT